MSPHPLKVLGLALPMAFAVSGWAEARDLSARPFTNLYVFGDSLSDSGNLFAVTGDQPESPPYFEGRFSDGPVWVESLAPLLDLDIDFGIKVTEDPLANGQAYGSAQSGFGSNSGAPIGLLSQVESFAAAGGGFERDDLVIIWIGANDYFSVVNANPVDVVGNIVTAIRRLTDLGGRRFFIVNLPDLGDTPFGIATRTTEVLNLATATHNALLEAKVAGFRLFSRLEVALFDVNATFRALRRNPEVFGFENITLPCLTPDLDGAAQPTGVCTPEGDTFDSTGTLFWDLVHPTEAAHRDIAISAHAAITALQNRALRLPGLASAR